MADSDRQRQFDAWKSRLLQAAVDDFEVVMTAIKSEEQSIMRLERLPKALVDYSKVHHVGGGPYKGILINKQAADLEEVMTEEARLEFMAYLSEQEGDNDHIQDYWTLKFWFQGNADGLKRKKTFTDYFQELMNPKNFPKNYIGFMKRALVLLKKYDQIRRVDLVVQKSDAASEDEELPPIKSFVTVYTPASYTYQLVPEVQVNNKTFLAFKLKAGGDAHMSLSAVYGDLQRKSHEIVFGTENNSKSQIRDGSLGPIKSEALTYSILNSNEFRFFWISWADNHIEVGRGARYGQSRFLQYRVPDHKRFNVNCLAVSTGRASRGQWEFAELLGQMPEMVVPQMRVKEHKKLFEQNPPADDGTPRIFRTQSMMTIPSKGSGPRKVRRPVSFVENDSKTSVPKYHSEKDDDKSSSHNHNGHTDSRSARIFRTQSSLVISNKRPTSESYSGTVTNTRVVTRPWTGSQVITESWTNSRIVPDSNPNGFAKRKSWVATPAFQRPWMENNIPENLETKDEVLKNYKDSSDLRMTNHTSDSQSQRSSDLGKHWKSCKVVDSSVTESHKLESLWSNGKEFDDILSEKWTSHTYSSSEKTGFEKPVSPSSKRWSSCLTLPQEQTCYCNHLNSSNAEQMVYRTEFRPKENAAVPKYGTEYNSNNNVVTPKYGARNSQNGKVTTPVDVKEYNQKQNVIIPKNAAVPKYQRENNSNYSVVTPKYGAKHSYIDNVKENHPKEHVIIPKYRTEFSLLAPTDADFSLKGIHPPDQSQNQNPTFDFEKANKAARKQKAKMSLLWLSKRQRLVQVLEDAYPNSVQVAKLLETCKIKHSDMIAAVVMLKDLEKKEIIKEMENGQWMRLPKGPRDATNDIKMVDRIPILDRSEQPEIAIITALYCEKLAVDAMMENKTTYVRYKTEGESQVYTLGTIGSFNVVSTKLSRLGAGRNAMISAENTTTRLLGTFNRVEHVFLVGVGGAVPHFSDFSQHVRMGDVVVSCPTDENKPLYIQCSKVESMKGASGFSYVTKSFSCIDQSLRLTVQNLKRDFESGAAEKTFESYIEDAKDRLNSEESSFHRPSIRSDKLYLAKPNGDKIQMEHPRPTGSQARHYREGQPIVRYGVVGAGRFVARNDTMRREFAELNGIKVYDAEYEAVLQSLEGNRNDSLLIIRGVCDYLDGSNKDWQPYAALVAAAYMKAIISTMR